MGDLNFSGRPFLFAFSYFYLSIPIFSLLLVHHNHILYNIGQIMLCTNIHKRFIVIKKIIIP